jgi:transcriptional regulator with XRE-family HTH domain
MRDTVAAAPPVAGVTVSGPAVGERVRLCAATRGMSVRDLARRVTAAAPSVRGASYGGIRLLLEGKIQNPRGEILEAIADVLGVSLGWLVDGEGASPMRGPAPTVDVDAVLERIDRIMEELAALRAAIIPPRHPFTETRR